MKNLGPDVEKYILTFLRRCYKCGLFKLGINYGNKKNNNALCMPCTAEHLKTKNITTTYKIIMSYESHQLRNNSYWVRQYGGYFMTEYTQKKIEYAKKILKKKYLNRIFGKIPEEDKINFKINIVKSMINKISKKIPEENERYCKINVAKLITN